MNMRSQPYGDPNHAPPSTAACRRRSPQTIRYFEYIHAFPNVETTSCPITRTEWGFPTPVLSNQDGSGSPPSSEARLGWATSCSVAREEHSP